MEKPPQQPHKTKNNLLKFLSKPAPFSPGRDKIRSDHKRVKPHAGRGFSGSLIPDEARRRPKNGSFETQEPTSPKISCMGQIKHKKKICSTPSNHQHKSSTNSADPQKRIAVSSSTPQPKKRPSALKKLLSGSFKPDHGRRRSDASVYDKQPFSADRAPPLSQLKRFASGRETTLGDFDWSSSTQVITPFGTDQRNYYSDDDDDEEEGEEIIIPFSAPMIIGEGMSLQPRKEVNLWKRRTMDPPRPLRLNLTVTN